MLRAWCLSVMAFAVCMVWRSACVVPLIAIVPAGFMWIESRFFGADGPRRTFYVVSMAAVALVFFFSALQPLFGAVTREFRFFQF